MEKPQKTAEHEWLQQLAGEWTWTMDEPAPEPGQPVHAGIARSRMLGDFWLISDWIDDAAKSSPSVLTIGFDPDKGAFVGSFISAMMTRMWTYDGRLEDEGKTLILEAEGPHMTDPDKTMLYRDITRIQDRDNYTIESEYYDGSAWKNFMRARFTRKK